MHAYGKSNNVTNTDTEKHLSKVDSDNVKV